MFLVSKYSCWVSKVVPLFQDKFVLLLLIQDMWIRKGLAEQRLSILLREVSSSNSPLPSPPPPSLAPFFIFFFSTSIFVASVSNAYLLIFCFQVPYTVTCLVCLKDASFRSFSSPCLLSSHAAFLKAWWKSMCNCESRLRFLSVTCAYT